jgi:hypothetical protein
MMKKKITKREFDKAHRIVLQYEQQEYEKTITKKAIERELRFGDSEMQFALQEIRIDGADEIFTRECSRCQEEKHIRDYIIQIPRVKHPHKLYLALSSLCSNCRRVVRNKQWRI